MTEMLIALLVLGTLTAVAYWRLNPVLFMLLAGLSMMLGLNMPDLITDALETTTLDLALGWSLIGYSLFNICMSYRLMFWADDAEEVEED